MHVGDVHETKNQWFGGKPGGGLPDSLTTQAPSPLNVSRANHRIDAITKYKYRKIRHYTKPTTKQTAYIKPMLTMSPRATCSHVTRWVLVIYSATSSEPKITQK